jgi:hypothetical protein
VLYGGGNSLNLICTKHEQDLTTSGLPEHVQQYVRCMLIARGADQAFRTKKELVNFKKVVLHLQNMFETAESDLSVFCAMQYNPHEPETDMDSNNGRARAGNSVAATENRSYGETMCETEPRDASSETGESRRAVAANQTGDVGDQMHTVAATSMRCDVRDVREKKSTPSRVPIAKSSREEKAARKKRVQMLQDLDECRGMLHVLYVKQPPPAWTPFFGRVCTYLIKFCSRAMHAHVLCENMATCLCSNTCVCICRT